MEVQQRSLAKYHPTNHTLTLLLRNNSMAKFLGKISLYWSSFLPSGVLRVNA